MNEQVAHLTSLSGDHVAVPASQLPFWERLGYVRRGPDGLATPTNDE
mgnify:CR=1 FL=1